MHRENQHIFCKCVFITRDVTFLDVSRVFEKLTSFGYPAFYVSYVQGDICFSGKNVRFVNPNWVLKRSKPSYGECIEHGSSIALPFTNKTDNPWTHENKVVLSFRTDPSDNKSFFSEGEINDVVEAVKSCFQAIPDVVFNKSGLMYASVVDKLINSFSMESVNYYMGYDLKSAIDEYTTYSPYFPEIYEERLFQCWKCHERRPHWQFHEVIDDMERTFLGVLGYFVKGRAPCCSECKTSFCFKYALCMC